MNYSIAGSSVQSTMAIVDSHLPTICLSDPEGNTDQLGTVDRIGSKHLDQSGRVVMKVDDKCLLLLMERVYVGIACGQIKFDLNSQENDALKKFIEDYKIVISDATHHKLFVNPKDENCVIVFDECLEFCLRLEQAPITTQMSSKEREALNVGYWQGYKDGYAAGAGMV
ncbi:hypothetical protein [Endozoicomonas atrinae]|uniref:hypothetical protein n=1 Tax=Endozoicomonas atrinae TaxID=1333660 RepID=UPI003AFFCEE3